MRDYFVNLGRLFRRHYVEERNKYIAIVLANIGVPLYIILVYKDIVPAVMFSTAALIFDIAFLVFLSTYKVRSRYHNILESTLPVTVGERYGFILINSTLCAVLLFALTYLATILVASLFYPGSMMVDLQSMEETLGFTNVKLILFLLAIHAGVLIVTLYPRFKLMTNFVIAIALVVLAQYALTCFNVEYCDTVRVVFNIAVLVVGWVSGYFLLRKIQCNSKI